MRGLQNSIECFKEPKEILKQDANVNQNHISQIHVGVTVKV